MKPIFGLILPTLLLFLGAYLIISALLKEMFHSDLKMSSLFGSFVKYNLTFIILNLPYLIILYISVFVKDSALSSNGFRYVFFFVSLISCGSCFVLPFQRALQSLVKIGWIEKFKIFIRQKIFTNEDQVLISDINSTLLDKKSKDEYEWMEKRVLNDFMRDIFIGISYCIDNSEKQYIQDKIMPKAIGPQHLFMEPRMINLENYNLDDTIQKIKDYEVKIVEYSPVMFAMLRNKEGIVPKEMTNSFLPKNNVNGIKKGQGKSGAFFISTDDNQYIIKTLKKEELELIRNSFLEKYNKDFLVKNKNKDSILCPFYGIYKLITKGGHEILFYVMRNLFGNFKDNITCKYDLKGSTLGRKQNLDKEKVEQTVMKDINFKEIEKGILISEADVNRLRTACLNDSKFLEALGIIDYSLLVVKLSLSKEQLDSIFNNNSKNKLQNLQSYKRFLFKSLQEGQAYIISIIDYLTYFNFSKVLESNYKQVLICKGKEEKSPSCVEPNIYSERFIKFINSITDVDKILN